jgi:hypothetical protein
MRGQTCPGHSEHGLDNAQRPSVLHGILLVHDEIRKWIGLKLDQPACGQTEVQLVFSKAGAWREAEALRGCIVTATGKLYDSPTGYYSTGIAVSNAALKPDPSCRPSPVREDPRSSHPTKCEGVLRRYHRRLPWQGPCRRESVAGRRKARAACPLASVCKLQPDGRP